MMRSFETSATRMIATMRPPADIDEDTFFLSRAIELSEGAIAGNDGGPFGAVVVRDGKIVGEGWNRVLVAVDPTAHAEVTAIRAACKTLGTHDLSGTVLYTSCEPCPMCLASIMWARIDRVVWAAEREDAASVGFDDAKIYDEIALRPEDRSLPFKRLLRGDAQKVFRAWGARADKTIY